VLRGHRSDRIRAEEIEPVTVEGDRQGFARALENLIENALVHGPADGVVTVSLRRDDGRALLQVSDEGPGPDAGNREQLFERFWRGPGASGRPGSGLGLSIARTIVARHHGRITVEGSAFTIELPAAEWTNSHAPLSAS